MKNWLIAVLLLWGCSPEKEGTPRTVTVRVIFRDCKVDTVRWEVYGDVKLYEYYNIYNVVDSRTNNTLATDVKSFSIIN